MSLLPRADYGEHSPTLMNNILTTPSLFKGQRQHAVITSEMLRSTGYSTANAAQSHVSGAKTGEKEAESGSLCFSPGASRPSFPI